MSELVNNLSGSIPGANPGAKNPAAAAAGFSLLGTLLSGIMTNYGNDARMREQNMMNIAQWQRENAYNTPSAQMQRLRVAGINPALAYANGDLMNEAAPSPELGSNRITSPLTIDPLTAAQIEQLNSQAELNRSNIPVNEQHANFLREQARNLSYDGDFAAATYANRVSEYLSSSGVNIAKAQEELKYVPQNIKAEADIMQATAEKAFNEKRISEEQYKQAKELARKYKAEADIAIYDKDKAQFWHEVYLRATNLVQHTEDFVSFFREIINKPIHTIQEVYDYYDHP